MSEQGAFTEVQGGNLEIPIDQVPDNVYALIGHVAAGDSVYITRAGLRVAAAIPADIGDHFADIEDKYWRLVREQGISIDNLAVKHRWTPEGGPVPTYDHIRAEDIAGRLAHVMSSGVTERRVTYLEHVAVIMPAKMGEDYEEMEGAILMMDGEDDDSERIPWEQAKAEIERGDA